jgi:hypothetical protein
MIGSTIICERFIMQKINAREVLLYQSNDGGCERFKFGIFLIINCGTMTMEVPKQLFKIFQEADIRTAAEVMAFISHYKSSLTSLLNWETYNVEKATHQLYEYLQQFLILDFDPFAPAPEYPLGVNL